MTHHPGHDFNQTSLNFLADRAFHSWARSKAIRETDGGESATLTEWMLRGNPVGPPLELILDVKVDTSVGIPDRRMTLAVEDLEELAKHSNPNFCPECLRPYTAEHEWERQLCTDCQTQHAENYRDDLAEARRYDDL